MENILELYSLEENSRLKKKIKIMTVALGVFVFLALAACIVLLCLANTENARKMMFSVIAISSVSGCVAIYVAFNIISAAARKVAHTDIMLSDSYGAQCGRNGCKYRDHLCLAPSAKLKVVVYRRHAEYPLPLGDLEI